MKSVSHCYTAVGLYEPILKLYIHKNPRYVFPIVGLPFFFFFLQDTGIDKPEWLRFNCRFTRAAFNKANRSREFVLNHFASSERLL